MAVINVPTGLENLGADLEKLGQALAHVVFPGTIKDLQTEAMIRENPELGMSMARAVYQGGPGALKAAGVSERLGEQIATMFPLTAQDKANIDLARDPEYVRDLTSAARVAPQRATAEGRLATDVATQLSEADVPRLSAMVQAGQFRQAGEVLAFTESLGLIERRLISEALNLDLEDGRNRFMLEQLQEYKTFVNGLGSHLRGIANAAMINPGLAGHILAHEQMDLSERIARINMSGDEQLSIIEAFKLRADLRKEVTDGLDRLRAANDKGDENSREVAVADLQNLAQVQRDLISRGLIPPGSVFTAEMKDRWVRSGLAVEMVEAPGVNADWIIQGLEQHEQWKVDGTYQRAIESGIMTEVPNPLTLLQRNPAWSFLSPESKRKVMVDVAAGRTPELVPETIGSGNAQGAATPQAGQGRAETRAEMAKRIAELERIPASQRTPEQMREYISLKDRIRFGGSGPTTRARGPGGIQ